MEEFSRGQQPDPQTNPAGSVARGTLPVSAHGYAARVALFFGGLFLVYGVLVPYLPVWLAGRGLSAGEIGFITAAPLFVRLGVTPFVSLLADRSGRHRHIIIALSWVALLAAMALSQLYGFGAILLVAVLLALAVSTIMPLTETVAVAGVRDFGLDYGRMRLWGSLTFILATFLGAVLVDRFGSATALWLIIASTLATVAASHLLPSPGAAEVEAARAARDGPLTAEVGMLARHPLFLTFLVGVGLLQGAHAAFYTFGALHWSSQGFSGLWVGSLWAIGIIAEIALFAWSGDVVGRIGPARLLVLGGTAAVFRWAVMSLDPPLAVLVPLQLLHALSYGATHLAAIHFISRAVPARAAGTAQSLYATVAAGIAMGTSTLAAGIIYARWGGLAYAAMALLAGVGLLAALKLSAAWSGGLLWPDREAISPKTHARAAL